MPLTAKQQRFVDEYLIDRNATAAYRRAGYDVADDNTAAVNARRLLRNAQVRAAVEAGEAALRAANRVTAQRVIDELARVGFAPMKRYAAWGPDGVTLTPSDQLTDEESACVAEVSEGPGGRVRFKLHDKAAALTTLGKHLGLFKDPVVVKVDLAKMTNDQLAQLESQLAGAAAGGHPGGAGAAAGGAPGAELPG